ncbi:phage holin family protein [Porphyrobacter sp. TH134]|uniref:phage holin family protein n=1 Tax=Porphyrobacter sp. TH134 TaxID=2067450 RepID=UPI000C7E5BC6|nr:phage holin family protein [Porphyrobacter sp. TH134]PLK22518.1 phage holin family protein [Porphyrobacter sp. TH134]
MHSTDPGLSEAPDGTWPDPDITPETAATDVGGQDSGFTDLRDDISVLIEDARTYAEAEIAFQKTRASLAGTLAGRALVLLVLALVLLHIALIALAVGAVIALAPLVTIWGAIAIVVGVLLIGVAALVGSAVGEGKVLGALFAPGDDA